MCFFFVEPKRRCLAECSHCSFLIIKAYIDQSQSSSKKLFFYFTFYKNDSDLSLFDSVIPGARMVRELFVMAREHAPSIIFMDEIDSIGSSRLEGGSGGDSEVQRTMLELLNQLDGFEATKNIKVRSKHLYLCAGDAATRSLSSLVLEVGSFLLDS